MFSAQGVLNANHPFTGDIIRLHGDTHPNFEVTFSNDGQVSVNVKTQGKISDDVAPYVFNGIPLQIPTEVECEFSLDYNLEDGSMNNIHIKSFKQQFHMEEIRNLREY